MSKFVRIYLIIALFMGFLGLLDAILTYFKVSNNIYFAFLTLISLAFFFFNLFSISLFQHQRVEKIFYVLPVYSLVTAVLIFSVSLLLFIFQLSSNAIWLMMFLFGLLTSLFEIIFTIYLLNKVDDGIKLIQN